MDTHDNLNKTNCHYSLSKQTELIPYKTVYKEGVLIMVIKIPGVLLEIFSLKVLLVYENIFEDEYFYEFCCKKNCD